MRVAVPSRRYKIIFQFKIRYVFNTHIGKMKPEKMMNDKKKMEHEKNMNRKKCMEHEKINHKKNMNQRNT